MHSLFKEKIVMVSLKTIRILLILNFLALIVSVILGLYYDPSISPLIDQADEISVSAMSNISALLYMTLLIAAIVTLIYSSIAIWIEHRSGKWVFFCSIVLGEIGTYCMKIVATSGLTMCAADLYMLLSGMILAIVFFNRKFRDLRLEPL